MDLAHKVLSILLLPLSWSLYALSILWPRDQQLVVMGVHTSALSGNIPALLSEKTPDTRKVFVARSAALHKAALERGFTSVRLFSLAGVNSCLRAKTYLYSGYVSDICFWLSGGARRVCVWHGTPLKKIERDIDTGYYGFRNRHSWVYRILAPYLFIKPDRLLVASEYEAQCFMSAFGVNEAELVKCFPPRLLTLEREMIDGAPIVLYTPTWRDDHSFSARNSLDFDRISAFLRRFNATLILKLHPSDANALPAGSLRENISVASSNSDVYELLNLASVVITDYSSMCFEALYLGIPVLLYAPDKESFVKSSREMYISTTDDLKLTLTNTQSELECCMEKLFSGEHGAPPLPGRFRPFAVDSRAFERLVSK